MPRLLVATAIICSLGGCTCGPPPVSLDDAGLDAGTRDAGSGGGDPADGGTADAGVRVPHVVIGGGALLIDGKPTFLYGGDLHYFRVRAPDFDPAATEAMWAQSLDLMADAGMNLVTTYLPWDYHSSGEGQWDFSGARDVSRFLDLACARGFWVVAKPGPLITGEWPRGFGTFGAVPAWWKQAHPEALALTSSGAPFSFSPTGAADQAQPSLQHPTFLEATRGWYAQVLPRLKPYLGKCLIALQVDNETNLYWGSHFGSADYHPVALDHYRAFLEAKYGSIDALNARYGTHHARFADVPPPTSTPGATDARADNPWAADWYWAGQDWVAQYLRTLRGLMNDEGFREPDVLFFTNDSPFALLAGDLVLHETQVHDGRTKNASGGACGLDLYPRQDPSHDSVQDQPFQADYFTRLFDQEADLATGPQDWVYAAELQGGFFGFPVVGAPTVMPEATEALLARSIGRGLKGGAFYVMRDGLNLDNSAYDYQAAITRAGATTPRYDVIKRWGQFLSRYGTDLLGARAVNNRVAVLTNAAWGAPQGGLDDSMQRLATIEQPAVFGWLVSAGLAPEVLDVQLTSDAELATYRAVFFLNPDFQDDATAAKLTRYAQGGGLLVTMLWPGRLSDDFRVSAASSALSGLYPANAAGSWQWLGPSRGGQVNSAVPGLAGPTESFWYESQWAPQGPHTPLLYERTALTGSNGDEVGWLVEDGVKKRVFLGTYVATRFNQDDYYALPNDEVARANTLARSVAGLAGERPLLVTGNGRHLAWARRSAARVYVFVLNDLGVNSTVTVRVDDLAALGLVSTTGYTVKEALRGAFATTLTGAQLQAGALQVPVGALQAAVLVVEPR